MVVQRSAYFAIAFDGLDICSVTHTIVIFFACFFISLSLSAQDRGPQRWTELYKSPRTSSSLDSISDDDFKKFLQDIMHDIEEALDGGSEHPNKILRFSTNFANNFNIQRMKTNLGPMTSYYSRNYRELFLDAVTSELTTHGIETGLAAFAAYYAVAHYPLSATEWSLAIPTMALAVPGGVDVLCWVGKACFITFPWYRKLMRKWRHLLLNVAKTSGLSRVASKLFIRADGDTLFEEALETNQIIKNYFLVKRSNNFVTVTLTDFEANRDLFSMQFSMAPRRVVLNKITVSYDIDAEYAAEPIMELFSIFSRNISAILEETFIEILKSRPGGELEAPAFEKLRKEFFVGGLQISSDLKKVQVEFLENSVVFGAKSMFRPEITTCAQRFLL